MTTVSPPTLTFKVHRCEPEIITPSKPTPHEFKLLSDVDDQDGLKFHLPSLIIFPANPSMKGKNPAKVIKQAVAKALVFYYPLAGRLREACNGKLIVECTGEGILFVEAYADVTLEQFGDPLLPPFPCGNEILCDVPGSTGILNSPLLLAQLTHLKCGAFTLGIKVNHTVCDVYGMAQFSKCVSEMAKGADVPSVLPVWERHVLNARNPPQVKYLHCEYDDEVEHVTLDNMRHQSFVFGPKEISSLRRFIPPHLGNCTNFELLSACVWKCRAMALLSDPMENMRLLSVVNLRNKHSHLLPAGYYGNAFVFSGVETTAKQLCEDPLSYALELVKKTKDNATEDHVRSIIDLMVVKNRPHYATRNTCIISHITRAGIIDLDWGGGGAVYGGPLHGDGAVCYFISTKNKNGEHGIGLLNCLPAQAMDRFMKELNNMLQDQPTQPIFAVSAL